ncbi:MAG: histidinol phosphatase [Propionibacteriaceae bacterium]|jgi:histidinol-phosphatase|nr:histidinol phosphatase [Propionibacteriaceae bacterium]
MKASPFADDLRLAHVLADQADSITAGRFKALDLRVDRKPDLTPVTDADLAVEDALRALLSRSRARDSVLGEERGLTGTADRRWVLDPIDATKNFVRGVPVWATLIALMDGDEVVVGLVSAPALNRRWWAARGTGAFTGRSLAQSTPLSVSKVSQLADASLSYSDIGEWVAAGRGNQFAGLLGQCWRDRGFGDFWSYMLVAEGACDIACEPELALHDMAACAVIVTEAGGRFTSIDGKPGPFGPGALASNGLLHGEVLAQLAAD